MVRGGFSDSKCGIGIVMVVLVLWVIMVVVMGQC